MEQTFRSQVPASRVPGSGRARDATPTSSIDALWFPDHRHRDGRRRCEPSTSPVDRRAHDEQPAARTGERRRDDARRTRTRNRDRGVYCVVTRKLAVPLASRNFSRTVQVPGTPVVVAKVPFSPSER